MSAATAVVRQWVRLYTAGLPAAVAAERRAELDSDLHEHVAAGGNAPAVLLRMVRGLPADVLWRGEQLATAIQRAEPDERRRRGRATYRRASAAAATSVLALVWMLGALGIVGSEGDHADRLYLGVIAIGIVGAAVARLRPAGLAVTLVAMAVAQTAVGVIAIAAGEVPAYNSPAEVLGLNAMFAALYVATARWFRRAAAT